MKKKGITPKDSTNIKRWQINVMSNLMAINLIAFKNGRFPWKLQFTKTDIKLTQNLNIPISILKK